MGELYMLYKYKINKYKDRKAQCRSYLPVSVHSLFQHILLSLFIICSLHKHSQTFVFIKFNLMKAFFFKLSAQHAHKCVIRYS